MSGITALMARERSNVSRDMVEAMLDRIDHRGPDSRDTWCSDAIGLGHQQLRSVPEDVHDDQPLCDTDLVVTADARIDNRDDLFESLPIGATHSTVPDSRLILEAYRAWGTRCVEHLIGSFSFVIWDRKNQRLFCARDRFGVKPFYYHQTQDTFAVASEKKGLLDLPSVSGAIDEVKVGDFLLAMYEDTEKTFFRSLKRLPPAHAMTVTHERVNTWQYWDLDPTRNVTLGSDAAYERRFRELFEQAVQARLRTNGRIGTTLSGGIDSSSITVVARDLLHSDTPLPTFSNVYDNAPSSDEREYIETVTAIDGIESHYVSPENVDIFGDEEALRTYLDQPPHNTMHFAVWERTRRAAETDTGVVLGGALGDSAIGYGLGLLPELLWTGKWRHLYRELRSMGEIVDAPPKHLFKRHIASELIPESIGRQRQRLRGDPEPVESENPTLDPTFIEQADLRTRYKTLRPKSRTLPRARYRQRRSLLTGRNVTNFEALDLVHAALGVEPRYPFTDKRLVEFSLAIPPSQQFADGWTRSIVRRALDDLLPSEIQRRPWKTSVSEAFWNTLSGEDDRIGSLTNAPGHLESYLDPDLLDTSRTRFNEERNSRDGRALWRALSLSVWLEEWPDYPVPTA